MVELDPISLLSIILIQVGSRHLQIELTDYQKNFLKKPITQATILTALIYVSTKDIKIALITVLSLYFLVQVDLNEEHPFSILSKDIDIKGKYNEILYKK